jgi:hypothetical protein
MTGEKWLVYVKWKDKGRVSVRPEDNSVQTLH